MLKFLTLPPLNLYGRLCLEEYLLRTPHLFPSSYLLLSRHPPPSTTHTTLPGKSRSMILGIGGKLDLHLKRGSSNITCIKRFTGGGTVVTDDDTIFLTFICRPDFVHKNIEVGKLGPREIMKWSGSILSKSIDPLLQTCTFSTRENDYILSNNMKVGGNAQAITKGGFCHHTSLLWTYKDENMEVLKEPEKRPEYRGEREHGRFITRLEEYCGGIGIEEFEGEVGRGLREEFGGEVEKVTFEGWEKEWEEWCWKERGTRNKFIHDC
ncbi:hypothetical protein TrLO_g7905 [Triparma laevis f. longispina]|uniref:BPL/LPL catalytic domain-containing protein n=1 Tax=Triparma laevis f. longispina TaxID=1714387 RepID=A0A9W7L051_9STRA|nr:hypothetical protein TrLO_g7905 [Triparma laevis f. longispina]